MVTAAPVFAHLTVTHAGTAFSMDNDIIEVSPTLSADSRGGTLEALVRNDTGQYGTFANPIFQPGDSVTVSIYKTGLAPTNIFKGYLVAPRYVKEYGGTNNKYMRFRAADGSLLLQSIFVNTAYQTFLDTDPGKTVSFIAKDLITNTANQMDSINGHPYTLPITVNNVNTINIYIRNIVFSQQSIYSALSQLAQYSYSNFYVDANLDLHFFQVQSVTSASVLDDTLLRVLDVEDDGTDIKSVVAVNGGQVYNVDDAFEDYQGGNTTTYNQYLAVQFTAKNFNLNGINMVLTKTQSSGLVPVNDLNGEIRTDNGNTPDGGSTIVTFKLTGQQVNPAAPTGTVSQINLLPTGLSNVTVGATLVPGNKYWIILYASGQNASNHYNWYYGSTATARNWATSPTGAGGSWTVTNSSAAFAFETLIAGGILTIQRDDVSIAQYGGFQRDTSIQDLSIPKQSAATNLAVALLGNTTNNWGMAKKKRFLRVEAFPPDVPINPGELVEVKDTDYGLDDFFTALQIQYVIKGYECTSVSYQLQRFLY